VAIPVDKLDERRETGGGKGMVMIDVIVTSEVGGGGRLLLLPIRCSIMLFSLCNIP